MQITVQCPLPGLATVAVTYNLMASERQINQVLESVGGDAEQRGLLIVSVTGWPEGDFGADPFGPDAPMAFRIWALRAGYQQGIREFIAGPNF